MLHHDLFPQYRNDRWGELNLNKLAKEQHNTPHFQPNKLLDPNVCSEWIEELHKTYQIDHSYGGYWEDRSWLWRGHYHQPGHMTHIGIDYNVPVGSFVYMPKDGELVMIENDPDQHGGWGKRAIFKMSDLYVTFAHIWFRKDMWVGQILLSGDQLGIVPDHTKNGGWYPHLHVHCQTKYDPSSDGYQYDSYEVAKSFPNPETVLGAVDAS